MSVKRWTAQPETSSREGCEHHHANTRNLRLFSKPRAGWHHGPITQRCTMMHFTHRMNRPVSTGLTKRAISATAVCS